MAWAPRTAQENQEALDNINATGDYNDEIAATLKSICDGFAEKGAY